MKRQTCGFQSFCFFFKYEAIQGTEKFLAAFLLGKV